MKFSRKIMSVEPSATLAITSKAKSLLASGEDVVILAAGEPDFDTPEEIKEAAHKAIKGGHTKYTPASGTLSLKKAICRKLSEDNGLEYEPANIVVSNGAKHTIYNVLQAICNTGDEVVVIHPFWLSYPEMVKLAGGEPKILKTDIANGYRAKPEDIEKAITDKTKAVIINSPSNPAGVVYSEEELKAIAEVCTSKGVIVISDEIYEKIIFDGKRHFSIAKSSGKAKDLTVVVNGVSKSHSMTGWRIGYMAGSEEISGMVATLQSHSTSNPASISQAAAEEALTSKKLPSVVEENKALFQKRRDVLYSLLEREERIRPYLPQGAFYMFSDISRCGLDSLTFSKRLLEEAKVAVIPGGPFGEDSSVRISFATDLATIEKGINRIKDWIKTL